MYYTIYKTTNLINNKIYIGFHQTTNPYDSYLGSGKLLKKAIKKYHKENFKKEVLHIFTSRKDMVSKEIEIVDKDFIDRDDTYNLNEGGLGVSQLVGESYEESISKMKKTLQGQDLVERSKKRVATLIKKYGKNIFKEMGKQSSITQKKRYKEGYINPNTNPNDVNIYNSDNVIQYTCKRKVMEELCDLHNLPKRVLLQSLVKKGIPLYLQKPPRKKDYLNYKGWYALYSNETRIDLDQYIEDCKKKLESYKKHKTENTCFSNPKNRGKKPASNYEIYDSENTLIHSFKENIRIKLAELGLPVNSFVYSYRNNTKVKKEGYVGWYAIKLSSLARKNKLYK